MSSSSLTSRRRPKKNDLLKMMLRPVCCFVLLIMTSGASLASPSVGINFTASTFAIHSEFIPPDANGAIGPDHFVELINGRFSVYDKHTGALRATSTLNAFWSNAQVPVANFAFDPRIVFDIHSSRWYAASVDNARGPNNVLVAVSDSDDPTAGWSGFAVDSDSADTRWADFPQLGIDEQGVYIAANMFGISGQSTTVSIYSISKQGLMSGVLNNTTFENLSLNATGFTPQPVVDLDGAGTPQPLLSAWNTSFGLYKMSSLEGNAAAPVLNTAPTGFFTGSRWPLPPDAKQPGTSQDIETNDSRFSSSVILRDGDLWAVHSIELDGRSALEVLRIDDPLGAPSIAATGLLSDLDMDLYYGSIAVNDSLDIVIGYAASGPGAPDGYASSYAAVGQSLNDMIVFEDPLLLAQGVAKYARLDGGGLNRWGDYSATTVDPNDPMRFWTIQEFASGENEWSTQISEIIIGAVPAPGSALLLMAGLITLVGRSRVEVGLAGRGGVGRDAH